MSKRKINLQQQRRITKNQTKLLDGPELSGLVLANYGKNLEIEDATGKQILCRKRQHLGIVVPGDRVIWQMDLEDNTGVVLTVQPRTSLLSRPDARGAVHAVAANVDQIFIVIAPTPAPNQTTIDRYLIAAETENIQPIIVLNKEDLLANDPQREHILNLVGQYKKIGLTILTLSATKKQHLSLLHAQLANKISVFVGQSGVGKSSLIAEILQQPLIRTGELSSSSQQGQHTTTTARLYHLDAQPGSVIDSPGIREFPLWPLDPSTLAYGFIEFRPFLQDCKYRNCLHTIEPGCALLKATANGSISNARLLSYQKILATMKDQTK